MWAAGSWNSRLLLPPTSALPHPKAQPTHHSQRFVERTLTDQLALESAGEPARALVVATRARGALGRGRFPPNARGSDLVWTSLLTLSAS